MRTTPWASDSWSPSSNWLGALNRLAAQLWPTAPAFIWLMPSRSVCSRASPAVCSSAPAATVMLLVCRMKLLASMSSTGMAADEYESMRDSRLYQSDSKSALRPADSHRSPAAMTLALAPITTSLSGRRSTVEVPTTTPTPPLASALASTRTVPSPRADITTVPGDSSLAPAPMSTRATSCRVRIVVSARAPAPRPAASNATRSTASIWFFACSSSTGTVPGLPSTVISASSMSTMVFSVSKVLLSAPVPLTSALAEPDRLSPSPPSSGLLTTLSAPMSMSRPCRSTLSRTAAVTAETMVWELSAPAPEMKPAALARSRLLGCDACSAAISTVPAPRLPRSILLPPLAARISAVTVAWL